jgi:hypothetical protein
MKKCNFNFITTNRQDKKRRTIMKVAIVLALFLALCWWGSGFYLFPTNGMLNGWGEGVKLNPHNGSDAEQLWQINAYFARGIDPLKIYDKTIPHTDDIGAIGVISKTSMPWTPIISQVLIPGFLPWNIAVWWFMIFFIGLVVIAMFFIWKLVMKNTGDSMVALLTVSLCLAQYGFAPELKWLNPGGHVFALLIICALIDNRKYPLIAGVCLGLAMIKPQAAVLFFIPFLVRGNLKTLVTAGLIVVVPWLINAWIFSTNPIRQLLDYYETGSQIIYNDNIFNLGLLNPLKYVGVSAQTVNQISMLVGLCITSILCYRFKKAPSYILFSICAVISLLWSYVNVVTFLILSLLIVSIILTLVSREKQKYIIFLLFSFLIIISPFNSYIVEYSRVLWPTIQYLTLIMVLSIVLTNHKNDALRQKNHRH